MKKGLFILVFTFLFSWAVLAQEEPFKIGGKSIAADGSAVYATDVSMLNLLGSAGEINMSMQYREKDDQWVILMTVPYKEINIPASSTLQLTMKDGKVLSLPVEREMVWSKERISVKAKVPTYVLRIPYLATNQQIETLTGENGNVTKVSFAGKERTIEFKVRNAFTSIVKRDQKAILAMRDGAMGSAKQTTNSRATSLSGSKSSDKNQALVPITTPKTKYYEVSNLKELRMCDCSDGHFIVIETNTLKCLVFDKEGNLTGKTDVYSLLYKTNSVPTHSPEFSDGKAIVVIPDGFITGTTIPKGAIVTIDYNGNVLSRICSYGDYSVWPDKIVDGIMGIGHLSLEYGNECYFLSEKGQKIERTGYNSFEKEYPNVHPYPVMEGRRLFAKAKYGYLDIKGREVIPPRYDNASSFSEGLAAVAIKDGEQEMWGFIDTSGNMVIPAKFSNRPDDFHEGLSVVRKKNRKYVYIDKTGNAVSPEFSFAQRFFGGYAITTDEGYLGSPWAHIIDKSFNKVKDVNLNGMGKRVLYSESSGTINIEGNTLRADGTLFMNGLGVFREGLATNRDHHCYVNTLGEIVLQFVESEF